MTNLFTGHEAEMASTNDADAKFDAWWESLNQIQRDAYLEAQRARDDAAIADENGMVGGMFGTEKRPANHFTDEHKRILASAQERLSRGQFIGSTITDPETLEYVQLENLLNTAKEQFGAARDAHNAGRITSDEFVVAEQAFGAAANQYRANQEALDKKYG